MIDLLLDMRKDLCSANVGYENGKGSTGIFCEGEKQFQGFRDKTFKMLLLLRWQPICMKDARVGETNKFADLVSEFAFS